jgi:hypothetical protein
MNIFVLDKDPRKAAQMCCNKHVVKMILESWELLEIACCKIDGLSRTDTKWTKHWSHPCAKWAAASSSNWLWLHEHGKALCEEYTYRYGKIHSYHAGYKNFVADSKAWDVHDLTPFVQCMLPEYRAPDAVDAYRAYYSGAKRHLLTYTKREVPDWLREMGLGVQK